MPTDAEPRALALGNLEPRGTRRLIYNSDPSNTTAHLSDPAAQPKELRQIVRNYAKEGGIDTVVQEVFAEAMTMFWRTDKCPYDIRHQHQRLVPMMDDGLMPVEIYIDECHKQGMECLAGFRMNDRHGHHPRFFEKLYEEKPDWLLRGYKPTWGGAPPESHAYGCALNYAVEGVRDWLFSIMEEVATRFDVDGIEFNFTRLAECFPKGEAAKRHGIMTGFVRRVRRMLDEASKKSVSVMSLHHDRGYERPVGRDRKLLLGVRVPQQLGGCLVMGLDIPTWIEEGLVDYVAPSDFGFTDFNERYEDFTSLARGSDCYIYPQVQTRLGVEADMDMEPARYRAAVRNFYAAGADGFSAQNYFFHWEPRFAVPGNDGPKVPEMYPAALNYFKELRSPESIAASGDRHYVFLPLWADWLGGGGISEIYEREEIVLSRKEMGQRGAFRFRVCEDFPAEPLLPLIEPQAAEAVPIITRWGGERARMLYTAEEGSGLFFIPMGMTEGDEIAVDINGEAIPPERLQWKWYDDERPPSCTMALSSPPFVYGDNVLGLRLTKSADGAEGDIVVQQLECWVRGQGK
jgi:hypothetical protein